MADQDGQYQDGEERTPGRRQYQQFPQRSNASSNWRNKDNTPRADPQPRQNNRQSGQFGAGPPQGGYGQQRESSDTRLYVGNLLYSASKDDIAQFFADNGFNVVNLNMSIDPETGRNPSYCFADFETAEIAQQAMSELNGKDVLGRSVRINPGMARKPQEGQASGNRQMRGWGVEPRPEGSRPFTAYNRSENTQSGYTNNYSNRDTRTDNQENTAPTKRLYIGNLPAIASQDAVDTAIHNIFDPLGIEITSISKLITPHESKKELPGDHHFLFVDLARAEDADAAIEALDGKPTPWSAETALRVNKAREQAARRPGGDRGAGGYQRREYGGEQQQQQGAWRGRGQQE